MSDNFFESKVTKIFPSGQTLEIVRGDITLQDTDAIVNAANAMLSHGGGVARHITDKGGRVIQEESKAWIQKHGPVSHSKPAVTSGGNLPCKFVIHAVGPVWGEGDEDHKLEAAILGCFNQAGNLMLSSISFPAISTGIYCFPKDRAALIFMRTIKDLFDGHPDLPIHLVRIVLYDESTLAAFMVAFKSVFQHEGAK